ncbi:MAG: aminotransferase class I/II-fold pyridoxal phosphate-dependent enzyme [Myxococcales bacterium]|nr:aminotransferase class I/II-fold pyridoxal phosphate-dependent enzyme [Myxococcales bacterium]
MSDVQFLMPKVLRGREGIYSAMSQRAREYGAADLAQGYPTIEGPREVREHAARELLDGPQQYIDPRGLGPLRDALAGDVKNRYGVDLDVDSQVTVTAGAQAALAGAMLGLLEAGDEVVFIEPFYNPVVPVARLTGATLKFVSLRAPDFTLNEDELLTQMSDRTKLIVYNTPNNPSGHVLSRDEIMMVARACERFDAYLIADEVYEHLVFPGHEHVSALQIPELRDRSVVISSFSKTFLMTGWRVGWALGAAPLIAGIRKVSELTSFCLPSFVSEGARFALEELPDSYLEGFGSEHLRKRDLLCDGLGALGLDVLVPDGTFFCSIDIGKLTTDDDLAFCLRSAKDIGVAAVPMSLSWSERREARNLVRFCFAKKDETLHQAIDAFASWMDKQ